MILTKNGFSKEITNPEVSKRLLADGWVDAKAAPKADAGTFDKKAAIEALKAKGVEVHHSTGADKLKALLEEHSITLEAEQA